MYLTFFPFSSFEYKFLENLIILIWEGFTKILTCQNTKVNITFIKVSKFFSASTSRWKFACSKWLPLGRRIWALVCDTASFYGEDLYQHYLNSEDKVLTHHRFSHWWSSWSSSFFPNLAWPPSVFDAFHCSFGAVEFSSCQLSRPLYQSVWSFWHLPSHHKLVVSISSVFAQNWEN